MPASDDQRARLIARAAGGETVAAACAALGVNYGTGKRWWREARRSIAPIAGGADGPDGPEKEKPTLDDLLLRYADAGLETLAAQAALMRDETWVKRQDADKLAIAHGVLADKCARIVEIFGARQAARARAELDRATQAGAVPDGR